MSQLNNRRMKRNKEEERTGQEILGDTYVDILITKLCKASIYHRISCTNKCFLLICCILWRNLELVMRQECVLTDLSNCLFAYIAGEVIPTTPPEIVVRSVQLTDSNYSTCNNATKEMDLGGTLNSMGEEGKY